MVSWQLMMRKLDGFSSTHQSMYCFVPTLLENDIPRSSKGKLELYTHIIRKLAISYFRLHFIALSRGNTGGCPREPWHDLHSKIGGPAAYDVLTNFEERWLKASKPHGIKKLKISYDDALLRLERIPDVIGINDTPSGENDPESWHVQANSRNS
ncbi:unnamed protein product [Trifolium pratense]|uniref:Uncharacterized protein n=1 Tax=Trifolium pratense TaxID=57577 RepID=A0ACB0IC61_TRIPR|nr:unnamed protein product [Trifolium pratense]